MSNIERVVVTDPKTLVDEIIPDVGFDRASIFRGQADVIWDLLPSLLRKEIVRTEFSDWADLELAAILRSKRDLAGKLAIQPHSELEWHAINQMRGRLSRLSAWTTCPTVALYMACASGRGADGALWQLFPADRSVVIDQDHEMVPDQALVYQPRSPELYGDLLGMRFLSHPLPPKRDSPLALDEMIESGAMENFTATKIIIPAAFKSELRAWARKMNPAIEVLLEGKPGVGDAFSEGLYSHTDSYDWITGAKSS